MTISRPPDAIEPETSADTARAQPARPEGARVKVAYFVHDLFDASVHRRVRMLQAGGATVVLIGFRRGDETARSVEGALTIDIGRTRNGKLARRMVSVARALTTLGRLAEALQGVDAIVGRSLEMLPIAARARRLYAPRATLTHECLDIHRILLSQGIEGSLLRLFESRLWRNVDLLLTSSPAFIRHYFSPRRFPSPIRLVENKMLSLDQEARDERVTTPPPGPPWRIGWFGMIRCRRSVEILRKLAKEADGAVEVIIRGRPSDAIFPDFEAAIADAPHIRFEGPYRNPQDLPAIYGEVHFNWAIDYYEDGLNSSWLLPNRIYEGSAYGAVPIALARVETATWLARQGVGVVLDEPLDARLADFFASLDGTVFSRLAGEIASLPRARLVDERADCRELVRAICGGRARAEPAWSFAEAGA
jgi:glycosyltransferase involved in cell wall biosynthesis